MTYHYPSSRTTIVCDEMRTPLICHLVDQHIKFGCEDTPDGHIFSASLLNTLRIRSFLAGAQAQEDITN